MRLDTFQPVPCKQNSCWMTEETGYFSSSALEKTEIFLPKEELHTCYPTELQLDYHIMTGMNDHSPNQHQNMRLKLRSLNGAKFQVVVLLQQTPQTCKFLGFHTGEVDMSVLLRYGVVSLDDCCPTFPDSRVDSSHSTLEDETTMPF